MMRWRLDLAYDGTDFHGWAAQPGLRTVQEVLETGIANVLRLPEPPALVARLLGEVATASDLALIDTRVDALPGLAGLHLASTAARTAGQAAGR